MGEAAVFGIKKGSSVYAIHLHERADIDSAQLVCAINGKENILALLKKYSGGFSYLFSNHALDSVLGIARFPNNDQIEMFGYGIDYGKRGDGRRPETTIEGCLDMEYCTIIIGDSVAQYHYGKLLKKEKLQSEKIRKQLIDKVFECKDN